MSCPGLWGPVHGVDIAQAVGASAEMELRDTRPGGGQGQGRV